MCANDYADWIRREIDWLEVPLAEEKPLLGICLGAQMLARALGARVFSYEDKRSEIGYFPIKPTRAGDQLCAEPIPALRLSVAFRRLRPAGGRRIARHRRTGFSQPGLSLRPRAVGLQFHPEVTYHMMCRWTHRGAERLTRPGAQQPARASRRLVPARRPGRRLARGLPARMDGEAAGSAGRRAGGPGSRRQAAGRDSRRSPVHGVCGVGGRDRPGTRLLIRLTSRISCLADARYLFCRLHETLVFMPRNSAPTLRFSGPFLAAPGIATGGTRPEDAWAAGRQCGLIEFVDRASRWFRTGFRQGRNHNQSVRSHRPRRGHHRLRAASDAPSRSGTGPKTHLVAKGGKPVRQRPRRSMPHVDAPRQSRSKRNISSKDALRAWSTKRSGSPAASTFSSAMRRPTPIMGRWREFPTNSSAKFSTTTCLPTIG